MSIREWRQKGITPTGLRQFDKWMDPLPRNISPTDIDFLLESKGRVWVTEFKPAGLDSVPRGQDLVLRTLSRKGMRVWLVEDPWSTLVLNEPVDPASHLIYRVYEDGEVSKKTASIEEINRQLKEFVGQ